TQRLVGSEMCIKRQLLVVLRGCDPLLYQYVDGGGFFTTHGQPNKQVRLVWYIYAQRYRCSLYTSPSPRDVA
ncbi:hypothetical protein V3C21_24820, partial [Salmonella enterica subsp. enterica serovar Paratyphi B]